MVDYTRACSGAIRKSSISSVHQHVDPSWRISIEQARRREGQGGMHRKIGPWWSDVQKRYRDADHSFLDGPVTRIVPQIWTAADKERYGMDLKPQPCKREQIRVSLPHLPHSALGPAKWSRRTILPWYMGLNEDKETLDTEDSGTWSILSAAHWDLLPGLTFPSGLRNMCGMPPYSFHTGTWSIG